MKTIKSSFSLLLFAIMLFCQSTQISAAESIVFSDSAIFNNGILEYSISVSEKSEISGLTLTVEYSPEQLSLLESNIGNILQASMSKVNTNTPGRVLLTAITTEPFEDAGSIIYLRFQINSASEGLLHMDYHIDECIDKECNNISFSANHAKIINPDHGETADTLNRDGGNSNVGDTIVGALHESAVTTDSSDKNGADSTNGNNKEKEDTSETDTGLSFSPNNGATDNATDNMKEEIPKSDSKSHIQIWIGVTIGTGVIAASGVLIYKLIFKNRRK